MRNVKYSTDYTLISYLYSLFLKILNIDWFSSPQVMKYEDRLEKLRIENEALSDKVGKNATDMCRMEEQIQQFELELTISREKHRTCQQEVWVLFYSYSDFSPNRTLSLFIVISH